MTANSIFRLINKYEQGVKEGWAQKREEGEMTIYSIDGIDLIKVETCYII